MSTMKTMGVTDKQKACDQSEAQMGSNAESSAGKFDLRYSKQC
jgi:hypothetical protein